MKLGGVIDAGLPIILAICLVSACCRQAVRTYDPPARQRPWCATVAATVGGVELDAMACATTRRACEVTVGRGRRWGGLAGVEAISDCFYRP